LGNGAPEFPTPPSLRVTSPSEGSTVNGTVTISWSESGQSLAYTTVTIDGVPNIATGNSFLWNTTSLPDGEHTIVVNVTDTGGFSASQTVYLFTDNQLLAIEATISHLNQTLTGVRSQVSLLETQLGSLNQTLTSSIASQISLNQTLTGVRSQVSLLETEIGSLNTTDQTLRSEIGSLNQTLTGVRSQVSLLETQLGSLNTTVQNTQEDVNRLNDGYIAIAVIIVVLVAAVLVIMVRRRHKVSER
jgi:prefoldin subunit 5